MQKMTRAQVVHAARLLDDTMTVTDEVNGNNLPYVAYKDDYSDAVIAQMVGVTESHISTLRLELKGSIRKPSSKPTSRRQDDAIGELLMSHSNSIEDIRTKLAEHEAEHNKVVIAVNNSFASIRKDMDALLSELAGLQQDFGKITLVLNALIDRTNDEGLHRLKMSRK